LRINPPILKRAETGSFAAISGSGIGPAFAEGWYSWIPHTTGLSHFHAGRCWKVVEPRALIGRNGSLSAEKQKTAKADAFAAA
jgi:hypothetical protein